AAARALRQLQAEDGSWCFELEADCTIPAEYILMMHFMDELDADLQSRLARFLRRQQMEAGGWPLYPGGAFDMSCSVKAYYALKLAGDDVDAEHMQRARRAILDHGGAARSNVFTRIALALFGEVPWHAVPVMPVEIMFFPRWFPFSLARISYWSRTVVVPLLILMALKPRAVNPNNVRVQELFAVPPEQERDWFPVRSRLGKLFLILDRMARPVDRIMPDWIRKRAIARAERWMIERLNGEDGLGAIFPAMVNAHESLKLLGYPDKHPLREQTGRALRKLLVEMGDEAYCQPCVSPVWDTGLTCLALQAAGPEGGNDESVRRGLEWLSRLQLDDEPGDWRDGNPDLPGGGWAFQYANPHYPDLDDTAVVAWAMHEADRTASSHRYESAVQRAADWLCGMQSRNGGFAAFDRDNTSYYLNHIPFADHGALLDPPTSDVSARCVALLSRLGRAQDRQALERVLDYLGSEQETDGSWFGRWGTNYIYGTWSVLSALETVDNIPSGIRIDRAVAWLKDRQNSNGGWGESNDSYIAADRGALASTAFQTAWAMLALIAAGEPADDPALCAGAEYLIRRQHEDGLWYDEVFTAPGFPRVFYLKYHGYTAYFPLWALARYRALKSRQSGRLPVQ
ncbi:MAG TPA: squalene--hopene cyclase, partial [Chromatiales bacterium]|nr:squalene--hopene cyclase [Chromatiales bacterium]